MRVAGRAGRRAGFDRIADVTVGADGQAGKAEDHGSDRDRDEEPSHSAARY